MENNIEYETPFKGLGLDLLLNVILYLLKENKITEDYIFSVQADIDNKNLVAYYNSLSFIHENKINHKSNSSNFALA